ncbi:MAG: hypothetical protein E7533_03245 [Ruminococcaceae bacterium]|nr:hypothetical protein [Oscillospiraceae bacterium]
MIKGVNKQVLELTETENGYFEKAIFFVKPEYSGLSEGKLRENARKELEKTGTPPKIKSFGKTAFLKSAGFLCLAFIIGLIAGSLLF